MKGGREAGEADRGFGGRRFLREGEGSEQLHGGEKVLYIRGEVAYNTARYWFCFSLQERPVLGLERGRREAVLFLLAELPAGCRWSCRRTVPARESAGAGPAV